ncbi:CHAT domain-containing protein [Mycena leptocephala]|nr:CHAT domain-containing protein [Mycena leptocephala]
MWALGAQSLQHPSLLKAYHTALDLLPEVAWLGLSITDRHHWIIKAGSVVRNAAAAAVSYGQLEKAVEWLEQGCSIVWGQLLTLRTPVDTLKEKYPELANELILLSVQLEGATARKNDPQLNISGNQQSIRRNVLLKRIRGFNGFHQFLLPKSISELWPAIKKGPVVFLNVSLDSCDALVLCLGNGVIHVPLPAFTPDHVKMLTQSLQHLMPYMGRGDMERLYGCREGGSTSLEEDFAYFCLSSGSELLSLSWMLLASQLRPKRIGAYLVVPHRSFHFIAIHAAGLYGKEDPFGSRLSDFVISSYTPSLAALIQGFRPNSQSQHGLQLLAVAQPSAIGQSHIPGTREEINQFNNNISTPTESALLLAGSSQLTLSRIIQLNLPHADFAFLSACQTATGDKKLREESVHLAAGMLVAGYRGVIATMWSIMDNDAPQVAEDVYRHLFKTSPPDSTRAAEALHLAVQNLREGSGRKKSFFHWVPFIHVGV